jgi:hypothetical protein
MSVFMMIPIPGTNTMPAMGIFIIGFGLLDDDGAISIAGLTMCTIATGVVAAIFILGAEVVTQAKDLIRNLIF